MPALFLSPLAKLFAYRVEELVLWQQYNVAQNQQQVNQATLTSGMAQTLTRCAKTGKVHVPLAGQPPRSNPVTEIKQGQPQG